MSIHVRLLLCLASFFVTPLRATGLPACVAARAEELSGNEFLGTSNNASYLCTLEQLEALYDPANIACGQSQVGAAAFACPAVGTTVQCAITIGWGSVAGTCSTCANICSTSGATGEASCCAQACSANQASDPCPDTAWIVGASVGECGSDSSGGYCDCCPDCGGCLKQEPPGVASTAPGLESAFCDCRDGLAASPDWTPCWGSCVDCFGDNAPAGQIAYPPAELIDGFCVGNSSCFIGISQDSDSDDGGGGGGAPTGTWYGCTSPDPTSCVDVGGPVQAGGQAPKFKGLLLCA